MWRIIRSHSCTRELMERVIRGEFRLEKRRAQHADRILQMLRLTKSNGAHTKEQRQIVELIWMDVHTNDGEVAKPNV